MTPIKSWKLAGTIPVTLWRNEQGRYRVTMDRDGMQVQPPNEWPGWYMSQMAAIDYMKARIETENSDE